MPPVHNVASVTPIPLFVFWPFRIIHFLPQIMLSDSFQVQRFFFFSYETHCTRHPRRWDSPDPFYMSALTPPLGYPSWHGGLLISLGLPGFFFLVIVSQNGVLPATSTRKSFGPSFYRSSLCLLVFFFPPNEFSLFPILSLSHRPPWPPRLFRRQPVDNTSRNIPGTSLPFSSFLLMAIPLSTLCTVRHFSSNVNAIVESLRVPFRTLVKSLPLLTQ